MEKKEYLNEEKYKAAEKKLLRWSKICLIVGVCLSAGILLIGIIKFFDVRNTNSMFENGENEETVDYVAETSAEIEELSKKLDEKKQLLDEKTIELTAKKNDLIARGISKSFDYNDGESYDLYILDHVLAPGSLSCMNDEYSKNALTNDYCSIKDDVDELEKQIATKQDYISSGVADSETKKKNESIKINNSVNNQLTEAGFFGFVAAAIPAFVFPAFIAFGLFTLAKRRDLSAFTAQQEMPIKKESIEKMVPTYGAAAGAISKEIAKGVKVGLKEDKKKEEKK